MTLPVPKVYAPRVGYHRNIGDGAVRGIVVVYRVFSHRERVYYLALRGIRGYFSAVICHRGTVSKYSHIIFFLSYCPAVSRRNNSLFLLNKN